MRCLLVTCHPLKDSLNTALAETVMTTLQAQGHEVMHRDLHAAGFDPRLAGEELRAIREGRTFAATVEETAELQAAECLVLIFPTWWFGLPAHLKGWVDRVWAPGIAYDVDHSSGALRPRLHGLKKVVVITTLGSPWWVDWLVMGRPVKRVLKRGLVGVCAPKAKFVFQSFYGCDKLSATDVTSIKQRVTRQMQRLGPATRAQTS